MENWKQLYEDLVKELFIKLSDDVKKETFFELIFMTYSYVHRKINEAAFPNATKLFSPDMMTGRGKGKYMYKKEIKFEAEEYIRGLIKKYFPNNKILYVV